MAGKAVSRTPRAVEDNTDRELAAVQLSQTDPEALTDDTVEGEVVGKKEYDTVKLKDKEFRLAESIGAMPMLKWAAAADLGADDPRGLAAIYAMLQDTILTDDWSAFEQHATLSKADAEELLDVVSKGLEVISGRPTKRQSGS